MTKEEFADLFDAVVLCFEQVFPFNWICAANLTFEALDTALRQHFTSEIEAVVGNDFNAENLTTPALADRFALLPTIINLRDNYGVALIGPSGETLGQWLSASAADLSLVDTILQAVEATAQALKDQIVGWSDPNTGYLRPATNLAPSDYLNSLIEVQNNAAAAFKLVADAGSSLKVTLAPTAFATKPLKLFGYLNGWDYAGFARRVIQIDHDIYQATYYASVASRLWNSQNWLPTSNVLLRTDWSSISGFADRGVTSIDPVYSLASPNSPYDLIIAYRARTATCSAEQADALCHDAFNCKDPAVIADTDAVNEWEWAGLPRTANGYLPFLPSSIITGCSNRRESLARGTQALWDEMGIFQSLEYVVRWVNTLEHGAYFNGDSLPDRQARIDLMQYLHSIYYRTNLNDRYIKYLAGMSSAVFEFDSINGVDHRTYVFLDEILKPGEEYVFAGMPSKFATEAFDIDWSTYDPSQYSSTIQSAVAAGATTTFGSTEFNNLNIPNRRDLILRRDQGEGWVDFITAVPPFVAPDEIYDPNNPDNIPDALLGVFLMTADQLGHAQFLLKSQG